MCVNCVALSSNPLSDSGVFHSVCPFPSLLFLYRLLICAPRGLNTCLTNSLYFQGLIDALSPSVGITINVWYLGNSVNKYWPPVSSGCGMQDSPEDKIWLVLPHHFRVSYHCKGRTAWLYMVTRELNPRWQAWSQLLYLPSSLPSPEFILFKCFMWDSFRTGLLKLFPLDPHW